MKFGKQILAQQIPGWSQYYLDYKGLKKIVSSLVSGRAGPVTLGVDEQAASAIQTTELEDGQTLALLSASGKDEDRGPHFHAHKAAFFFKLERELEKINSFYLQKEAELKLRLETLLAKRMAAVSRFLPTAGDSTPKDHVEWKAVEEGFRVLERDLAKLQQFVEINAIGFRKILKKWDKRSKSTTKELYLSRQVDVQPVFNRKLIGELSDVVAQCLLDPTDLTVGLNNEGSVVNDMMLTHQIALERSLHTGPYRDLETSLQNAVQANDERAIRDLLQQADSLQAQPGSKVHVTRVLWRVIIDAPPTLADLILSCSSLSLDFHFIDDINGRTCLHEAAISGEERLVDMCITKDVQAGRVDIYGRTALHYAAMNGHAAICSRLISIGLTPSSLDLDNYTPLMYAVLKGNTDCVDVLLSEGRAILDPPVVANDLIPLSLACRVGHIDVVQLLLQHNAKSVANTNGEFPIHIAAQEGHAEICRMLRDYEGWDIPDKYNEWTPLFHAARNGHENCVRVLLELGSRVDAVDETGRQAVFYAAWHGHPSCVNLLLEAATSRVGNAASRPGGPSPSHPAAEQDSSTDTDLDTIPSLSLPPPIMPYRVYGHNFLDKVYLIHVSIGHSFSHFSRKESAIRLVPRIMNVSTAQYPHISPLFKLVMTCRPDVAAAPYSVSIPFRDERDFFTFQTADLENVFLDFSICPNFGTKTIGRAVALSSMLLTNLHAAFVLPILDHRLQMIGEVRFEARIITPLRGITLEVGGAIDTYWKSLATPDVGSAQKPSSRMAQPFRSIGPIHASPSNHSLSGANGHTITLSSLVGDYIHLTVQVTRDLHPVVYSKWRLPVCGFDLGVSDVTLERIKHLISGNNNEAMILNCSSSSHSEWHRILSDSLFPLRELFNVLPTTLGIHLDLTFSSPASREYHMFPRGHTLGLNDFVDSVLNAVYHDSRQPHRRIVFGSYNADVCAALNWKQPNYPVFLASECGVRGASTPSHTFFGLDDLDDRRLSSISAAVDWAKANNLLGIFLNAELLTKVPSLIQGIKDAGLLLGVYGKREQTTLLTDPRDADAIPVDAFFHDGVVSFLDHSSRGLL